MILLQKRAKSQALHFFLIGVKILREMQYTTREWDIQQRRLSAHNLAMRRNEDDLMAVIGAIGLDNPQVQSALISICARMHVVDPHIEESETLCQAFSVRRAIRIFPSTDKAVFTRSLYWQEQEELDYFVQDERALFVPLGLETGVLFALVKECATSLPPGTMAQPDEFVTMLAKKTEQLFSTPKQEIWKWPSAVKEGQTLGEAIVHCFIPLLSLSGCLELRTMANRQQRLYVIASDQLQPNSDELVRRYIHLYGPTDPKAFATWANISFAHAKRLWSLVERELVLVGWDSGEGWILLSDVDALASPCMCEGIRFLPSYDPFLWLPQPYMLVKGKALHHYFFDGQSDAGMMLYDGQCVAGWRMKQSHNHLSIILEDIGEPLGRVSTKEIEEEVERLASALGMESGLYSIVAL